MDSNKITNVTDLLMSDASTKAYVDSKTQKISCRFSSLLKLMTVTLVINMNLQ